MADETTTPQDAAGNDTPAPPPPLDLRVARVTRAREHPDADRLLLLDVDLGGEERQLVAGIRGHYELTELEGKHIVVVANLRPATLRGEVSQGMLLAAEREGKLGLLLAPAAAPGTALRTASGGQPGPEKISIEDFFEHTVLAEGDDKVTLDGEELDGADLIVDRGLEGRLK